MKLSATILALVVLVLSVMPCEDPEVLTGIAVEQVACDQCDGDGIGDLCSPFCDCHCCSIHYIGFEYGNYHIIDPYIPQGKFVFMDSKEQEVLRPLHQPPRV